jgi:hypothetical protein
MCPRARQRLRESFTQLLICGAGSALLRVRLFDLLARPVSEGRVFAARRVVQPARGAVPVAGAFEFFAGAVAPGFLHERPSF